MTACPECEGVLVCAPGCSGPNAAARAEFVRPPRAARHTPYRRKAKAPPAVTDALRERARALAQVHPEWTSTQVSQALGVDRRTVRRWLEGSVPARRSGRPAGPTAALQRALELARAHPDWTPRQVAEEAGASPGRVRALLLRAGLQWPRRPRRQAAEGTP